LICTKCVWQLKFGPQFAINRKVVNRVIVLDMSHLEVIGDNFWTKILSKYFMATKR